MNELFGFRNLIESNSSYSPALYSNFIFGISFFLGSGSAGGVAGFSDVSVVYFGRLFLRKRWNPLA